MRVLAIALILGLGSCSYAFLLGVDLSDRYNFFSVELLQKLQENDIVNEVVSPSNIKTALLILAEAAANKTRQQIWSALRVPDNLEAVRNLANATDVNFASNGTEVQTAVRLWVSEGVVFAPDFSANLTAYYKGDVKNLDFANATTAGQTINSWIDEITNSHIDSIVDPASLEDAEMVLTSATYFKGVWRKAFHEEATKDVCFDVPHDGCYLTKIMHNKDKYNYSYIPALDAEVIVVPYTGERVAMMLLLPNKKGYQALNDLSRDLTFTPISTITATLKEVEVELAMPRFTIESKTDLKSYLMKMGIRDLFGSSAQLRTAFPNSTFMVEKILHKAKIEVNEEGTIAAAATGVVIVPLLGSTDPMFRATRPFIFLMVDLETNSVLFGGRVVKLGRKQNQAEPEVEETVDTTNKVPEVESEEQNKTKDDNSKTEVEDVKEAEGDFPGPGVMAAKTAEDTFEEPEIEEKVGNVCDLSKAGAKKQEKSEDSKDRSEKLPAVTTPPEAGKATDEKPVTPEP